MAKNKEQKPIATKEDMKQWRLHRARQYDEVGSQAREIEIPASHGGE